MVNVREGDGLFINENNRLEVNPGDGIVSDRDGVHIADIWSGNHGTPHRGEKSGLDIRARWVRVKVDNDSIRINSNNELESSGGIKNGRLVWGVVKTKDGIYVNRGSGDWTAKRYGNGRVKIRIPGVNLRSCAVIVSDYDKEGDHISGCYGEPGRDHGCDSDEVIIYSRDLQNLKVREAKALMDAIRAGETELPSIYDDAFDDEWDSLDDSTPGISFQIIFPS